MELSPVWISLKTALTALAMTFTLGLLAARGVGAIRSARLRRLIDALCALPLVLPPTVAGFLLLWVFGVKRPVGMMLLNVLGVKLAFSWAGTVLAAFVVSFPLMYRSARAALAQVDIELLDMAKTQGCGRLRAFFLVQLPRALPGVAAGAVMAFARGLGEFGATAMIAGNIAGKTRTLPLVIYSSVAAGDMGVAASYVWILIGISLLSVLALGTLEQGGH